MTLTAPYQPRSSTSKDAAEHIELNAQTLRAKVLAAIRSEREAGMTDEEVQNALCMNPSTERPRRIELLRMGLIANSGRWRQTKSGRKAVVWVAQRLVFQLELGGERR